jgi:hypothetical protein
MNVVRRTIGESRGQRHLMDSNTRDCLVTDSDVTDLALDLPIPITAMSYGL